MIFKEKVLDTRVWASGNVTHLTDSGLNWVAMGRHGLILKDNGAMGSGKVSECLPDLWDTI